MIEVEQLLDAIATRARGESGLRALFLLGSASRGELSYLRHPDGKLELFSDLEFLVVTDHRLAPRQRFAWHRWVEEMEARFANPNLLFHIDVAFRERQRLATLPPFIFTFEMKSNARLLYGEDVSPEIPAVTTDNLDYANTREILYKRLWAILLYMPRAFLQGYPTRRERRVMGYLLCRNLLDIPTVLLPHEGVLLPSYTQRVAFIEAHWKTLKMARAFTGTFPARLNDALMRRRTLDFSDMDLVQQYGRVFADLTQAVSFLLGEGAGGVPPGSSLEDLPRWSSYFFNERPRSRGEWYGRLRILAFLLRCAGPIETMRWMRLHHKGELTMGLIAMHRAALMHLRGREGNAEKVLAEAEMRLHRLWPCASLPGSGRFVERWLALRREWGEFWRRFIRLGDPIYARRFQRVMEWKDET